MTSGRKLLFFALMWLTTAALIVAGIELLVPRFAPAERLSRHRWGSRPHTFLPGVTQRSVSADYDVSFRSNALGFNDRDHAPAKPPGVFRVLLLGDSYVEGLQVAPERHMARVLEALAARDGRALEAIGMGMSGWGQAHELATYEAVGRAFDPDLVVVFFCINDLWNNFSGTEGTGSPPIYRFDGEGRLVSTLEGLPERVPDEAAYWKHTHRNRLPGLRAVADMAGGAWRALVGEEAEAARAAAVNDVPRAARPKGLRGPRGVRPDQQRLFEALVAEMRRRIVERDGREILSVTVSANLYAPSRRPFERLKRWVAETFEREGIDNLDADTLFRERARTLGRYASWPDDAHWNETGHAWIAELLYDRVERGARPRPASADGATSEAS